MFPDLYTPIEGDLYKTIDELTGGDPRFDYDADDLNEYYIENYVGEQYDDAIRFTGDGDDREAIQTGLEGDPVAAFMSLFHQSARNQCKGSGANGTAYLW